MIWNVFIKAKWSFRKILVSNSYTKKMLYNVVVKVSDTAKFVSREFNCYVS